ncbi:protein of unknown function [Taphrina deformans PYCC 5710]|uniref:SET domain-containing protein n=1 Tax=Taphrina deformans (strain PYCC 5710 / ATCC 11124 / CBS 356.35 / IMI 108563 / JCM 9778 / NBRC 8474) TaxID=1097556 RepID=R4XFN2_TAPDE|nr:protein of unknown function [Taphrina deformans PYCC 5710]|eukprot:CCG84566.1 protein of unknown function [Taphrina deformans PYCC 5710]
MLKRKLSRSLAEQVLDEKLEILRRRDHTKSSTDVKNIHSAHVAAFPYLLEICLAVEKASCQQLNNTPSLDAEVKTAEESGDYDYAQLQSENISQATLHAAYIGPVRVSSLPGPKTQGVVADRDIYKGELLCTSVPSIVVSNLVSVDEPTDLLFSDLSRAEMTAKLICLAEVTPSVRTTLKSFEFAEKDDIAHDNLTGLCEAVISKYTWAIDHPSTNPQGQKFKGKYTKVAGHAFTVSGYAGKFNHSCVPNATMVSYGAVQFFRASVAIPKDTEVCVSYGFDPLDPVHKRRDKLRAHAGFECCCPLCLYQLHHVVTPNEKAHRHESFDDLLHDVLSGTDLKCGCKSLRPPHFRLQSST